MNVIVDRRMLKSPHVFDPSLERWSPEACAECGKLPDEVSVELGEANADDWDWYKVQFCLPCLKRAVAEAEAAVAKDKA